MSAVWSEWNVKTFIAILIKGDLFFLLGGNVHIHYMEEKCYDEEIFFYHLGCHQWVSVGEGLSQRKCIFNGQRP